MVAVGAAGAVSRWGPREDTKLLGKLLKRSEKSLRKSCLAEAAELFGDSPKHSTKKLARKARDDLAGSGDDAGTPVVAG